MSALLRDTRVQRLFVANTLGSIGSGVTIFSVPWILVHRAGGNAAYLWATIATTVVLFLLMPYFGAWIDRHSRKTALLTSEAWGFFATTAMAAVGLWLGGFATWQLVTIFFCGMLYYTLHYPAKFAMIQQMFVPAQFQSLIGLLEIQGQTAMMIAGGLGGYLVERVPLWQILLFDASTYLISFLIQSTLPYEPTHLKTGADGKPVASRPSVWVSVVDGWEWLRARPRLTVFLTCSLMPFIVVMTGNYVFPIYVMDTLHAGSGWFAGGEITFAVGAVAAGAILPQLIGRHSAAATIPGTMLAFMGGLLVVTLVHVPMVYLVAGLALGFGNAGCRVARSALMLHIVPNEVMGRVGGFYNVLDRVLRTLLLFSMKIVDVYGAPAGLGLLLVVLLFALFGALQSRNALQAFAPKAAAAGVPA